MALTPSQATAQLARLADQRALAELRAKALKDLVVAIAKRSKESARQRGVIRRLFARRASGLDVLFRVSGATERKRLLRKSVTEVSLEIRGLAAIQETGGTTRPHVIKPKNAPKLVFRAAGRLVVTDKVDHPGATHPRIPSAADAFEQAERDGAAAIQDAMDAHINQALRS